MRRLVVCVLSACLSSLAAAGEPALEQGLSASQIIEKNVAARGGLEAWRKIQSMVWVGHVESSNAPLLKPQFVLAQKRPNMTRFEIQAQNQISLRVYDGTHGWKVRPLNDGRPDLQPYSREELSSAADGQGLDGQLMDYQTKGIVVTLDGIEDIEGHKAYRLNVRIPSGVSHHVWIDAKTFLDIKYDRKYRNAMGQSGTSSVFYRNYKTIEGLQIPLVIESGADITRASDKMVIDKVALNPPLDDMAFAKPNIPMSNAVSVVAEPQQAQSSRALQRQFMPPRSDPYARGFR